MWFALIEAEATHPATLIAAKVLMHEMMKVGIATKRTEYIRIKFVHTFNSAEGKQRANEQCQ